MRILCDYLCIVGFLNKEGTGYSLTQDSAVFLDKRSPAYLGGATEFISTEKLTDNFKNLPRSFAREAALTQKVASFPLKIQSGEVCQGDGADDCDAGAVVGKVS